MDATMPVEQVVVLELTEEESVQLQQELQSLPLADSPMLHQLWLELASL